MEKKERNLINNEKDKKEDSRVRTERHATADDGDGANRNKRSYTEQLCEFYVNKPKLAFGKFNFIML